MTRRPISVGAIVVVLLLAACDWLPAGGSPDLAGAWQLTSGTHGGEALGLVAGTRVTMTIDGDQIGGTAACNSYGGTFELDGDRISIGALSMTEMACDEPIMALEAAFMAALGDVETASRAGDRITLSGPDTELQFAELAPVPDAELIGPTWTLDSLISGDAVSSVMGEPATLELTEDGTISGSTGCRGFAGRFTISGDEVRVTEMVTDDRACSDELASQDDNVLAVIGDGFTAAIDGRRLTLMSGSSGLGYTAEE